MFRLLGIIASIMMILADCSVNDRPAAPETAEEIQMSLAAAEEPVQAERGSAKRSSPKTLVPLEGYGMDSLLEMKTSDAVNDALIKCKNGKPAWSSKIDVGMCSCDISQMKIEDDYYVVYGSVYLKDSYGHPAARYVDGSGSSTVDFKLKYDGDLRLVSTELK